MEEKELNRVWVLRKVLHTLGVVDSMELLIDKISQTKSNTQFLDSLNDL